jgi:hypothetical protein
MTEHTHRFWNMGNGFHCSCGATRADDRTPEQIAADRERSTIAAKIRVNAALGVDSPNLRAAIERR